jgi:hypothetical protein
VGHYADLEPGVQAQCGHDVADVHFHRVFRDGQQAGDLAVGKPAPEALQDVELPRCEGRDAV